MLFSSSSPLVLFLSLLFFQFSISLSLYLYPYPASLFLFPCLFALRLVSFTFLPSSLPLLLLALPMVPDPEAVDVYVGADSVRSIGSLLLACLAACFWRSFSLRRDRIRERREEVSLSLHYLSFSRSFSFSRSLSRSFSRSFSFFRSRAEGEGDEGAELVLGTTGSDGIELDFEPPPDSACIQSNYNNEAK